MHTANIVREAGVPKTLSNVASAGLFEGIVKKVTGVANEDAIVIADSALEKAALEVVPVLAGSIIQKRISEDTWSYMPFTKG